MHFKLFVSFFLVGAFILHANSVKLPSYFSKCSANDPNLGDCIVNSANGALPRLLQGDKRIHVAKLDPLFVPNMFIDVNGGLKINLTNSNIFGLQTGKITYFNWNAETKRVDSHLKADYTNLIGDYDINGRILILPINGNGPCNITFINPLFKFFFQFELEDREGQNYMKIINNGLTYETDRGYFRLFNLFNGNEELSKPMGEFLDENWEQVNAEIGAKVGDAIALVFGNILQQMFYRIPFDEFFNP